MLGLPLATGIYGFLPSLAVMVLCWGAMTLSALLLIEANLWMEPGAHVITMSGRLLGPVGRAVSWLLYLFIAYASLVAYTAGAGAQCAEAATLFFGIPLADNVGALLFLLPFMLIVSCGCYFVGRINSWLCLVMIAAYCALLTLGVGELRPQYLTFSAWRGVSGAVPMLLTMFSFQTMAPSVVPMVEGDPKSLRFALIGGTSVAFVVYALWMAFVLGIVPVEGSLGLREAFERGVPATLFLRQHVGGSAIVLAAEFFAFFAVVTSFLAMGLGLWDFLVDGLHIPNKGWGKLCLFALIAIPVGFGATQFERVFYLAMEMTGGFGDTMLNGMIPVLMVWVGRYHLGMKGPLKMRGGKLLLLLVFAAFAVGFFITLSGKLGVNPAVIEPYERTPI